MNSDIKDLRAELAVRDKLLAAKSQQHGIIKSERDNLQREVRDKDEKIKILQAQQTAKDGEFTAAEARAAKDKAKQQELAREEGLTVWREFSHDSEYGALIAPRLSSIYPTPVQNAELRTAKTVLDDPTSTVEQSHIARRKMESVKKEVAKQDRVRLLKERDDAEAGRTKAEKELADQRKFYSYLVPNFAGASGDKPNPPSTGGFGGASGDYLIPNFAKPNPPSAGGFGGKYSGLGGGFGGVTPGMGGGYTPGGAIIPGLNAPPSAVSGG